MARPSSAGAAHAARPGDANSQRRMLAIASLVVLAILLIAVVVVSNTLFRSARVDLTQDRLFTLSQGTKNILKEIDEPITLRFYFSSRLAREIPAMGTYAQRVRELLQEYAGRSGGKLKLEVYDPQPFTDQEDRATAFGIQGVPVDQGGELVYFGLAGTNSTDDRQVVPFFDQSREQFLEYDLTRIVYNLAHPTKKKIALITSLPLAGSPYARMANMGDDSWVSYSQLQETFAIDNLGREIAEVPKGVDVLLLVHPKNLSDKTLYAIDQYVLRGGKLLVFVDPYSEIDAAQQRPGQQMQGPPEVSSNLDKLLNAWGVEIASDKIVGDLDAARRVAVPAEAGSRVQAIDYPPWLALTPANFNKKDPVISDLTQVNMSSVGEIRVKEGAKAQLEPLIQTGARGGLIPVDSIRMRPNPVKVLQDFKPGGAPITLAARLTGEVPSAFPDGAPKEEPKEGQPPPPPPEPGKEPAPKPEHLAKSAQPVNVVVVADVDVLADALWVRVQDFFGQRMAVPSAQNGQFLVNAVDNLTGSSDLIGLRSRGVVQRPFVLIQSIQRDAEARFRAKEQELATKLQDTEKKLGALQGDKREGGTGAVVLSPEQRREIESFRAEAVNTRRELRDVQRALREDVERVSTWVKVLDIGLVPVLVIAAAIGVAVWRQRRRARAVHAGAMG